MMTLSLATPSLKNSFSVTPEVQETQHSRVLQEQQYQESSLGSSGQALSHHRQSANPSAVTSVPPTPAPQAQAHLRQLSRCLGGRDQLNDSGV